MSRMRKVKNSACLEVASARDAQRAPVSFGRGSIDRENEFSAKVKALPGGSSSALAWKLKVELCVLFFY